MSVQGPSPLPIRPLTAPAAGAGAAVARPGAPPATRSSATAAATTPAPAESSLWELLTDEEREFFSQQATLGALTYGRAHHGTAPVAVGPIGQRLDVKG